MEEHNIGMEDFGKVMEDKKNPHLPAPLPMKSDYLALDHCLHLKIENRVNQGDIEHILSLMSIWKYLRSR